MKLLSAVLIALLFLSSCQTESSNQQTEPRAANDSYLPAVFTDPQRLEKIRQAFPAIENIFKNYAEENHLPGLAFGLVVDGELVLTGNYGYTNIEKKIPVTSSSLFRIASMSKSVTAMAILKLRDEGKLRLDDPAENYIPELKGQPYPTADAPLITIRHLLTHGAGFPEDNPWGDRQLADSDKDLREFLNKKITFSNPPGLEYEYSNLGFALLGKIITTVSGMPYQQYIRQNIWQPLGMQYSEWEYGNIDPAKLAHGYNWRNGQWNEEAILHDAPDGSWGAMGSMITSIEEFAKYMKLHLDAWPPSSAADNGPVKRSSIREMHYPWRINGFNPNYKYYDGRTCGVMSAYAYGLGWMRDCDGKVYIAHSGGLPGFGSQWRIMPDYGIGIVSFSNRTYGAPGAANMRVLDTIIKIAGLKPRELPASEILKKRKDELVKLMPDFRNAETSGIFAENFFPDNPIDSVRKQTQQLFDKIGPVRSIREMKASNQLRGHFIIEGEKGELEVWFTLSPENPPLIQAYEIWERKK